MTGANHQAHLPDLPPVWSSVPPCGTVRPPHQSGPPEGGTPNGTIKPSKNRHGVPAQIQVLNRSDTGHGFQFSFQEDERGKGSSQQRARCPAIRHRCPQSDATGRRGNEHHRRPVLHYRKLGEPCGRDRVRPARAPGSVGPGQQQGPRVDGRHDHTAEIYNRGGSGLVRRGCQPTGIFGCNRNRLNIAGQTHKKHGGPGNRITYPLYVFSHVKIILVKQNLSMG